MGEPAVNADDAFDNLMQKNALAIPVANPGDDSAQALLNSVRRVEPDSDGAMRVMSLLDQVPSGDYNPHSYDDDTGGVYATPTETDLDPITDAEALGRGRRVSSTVVKSESDPADFLAGLADDSEFREVDASEPLEIGDAGLERARRLRRFAYLPLSGFDHFEGRARDIMSSVGSQFPDSPSLAITCPRSGDGQAEIAIRLALAAAKRVDYRVLLVDCDIREPQVAKRLGLSSKYFVLGDVLRSSCLLGEALMYSEEDNLYVLPSRASDRDGDEVLDDRQVQLLMTRIHSTFDFTIICCGSLEHADAMIVCRHAGATALAGFCGRTPARSLRDSAERLGEVGVAVAGLLLTGA